MTVDLSLPFFVKRSKAPPRTDPVSVLDLRLNLHKGESYGQEDILPITQFFTTALIKQGDISFIPV